MEEQALTARPSSVWLCCLFIFSSSFPFPDHNGSPLSSLLARCQLTASTFHHNGSTGTAPIPVLPPMLPLAPLMKATPGGDNKRGELVVRFNNDLLLVGTYNGLRMRNSTTHWGSWRSRGSVWTILPGVCDAVPAGGCLCMMSLLHVRIPL